MLDKVKGMGSKLINSPIGAASGALLAYFGNKKFLKVENKWGVAAIVIAGALVGAGAEYTIKAKLVKPAAAAKK